MRLEKIAPKSVLRFIFPPVPSIDVPAIPQQRAPTSMQGVLQIAGLPDGAAVAAGGGGAPDALRGTLDLQFAWGPLGLIQSLNINVYKMTDTVDPAFVQNPTNAAAGRTSMLVGAGDTVTDTASNLLFAVLTTLSMRGLGTRWHREGGDLLVDPTTQTMVIIVAPRTWASVLVLSATDAMLGVGTGLVQPAVVRPILYAGFHPGPWIVYGDAFAGYSPPAGDEQN
jgi:hypothetical protein